MNALMLLPERAFKSSSLPATAGPPLPSSSLVPVCYVCVTKDHSLWGLSNTWTVLESWRSTRLVLRRAWRASLFQAILLALAVCWRSLPLLGAVTVMCCSHCVSPRGLSTLRVSVQASPLEGLQHDLILYMAQMGFHDLPFLWGPVKPLRSPLVRNSMSLLVLPCSLHSGSCLPEPL